MHPIGDQIANAREVVCFGNSDDIERSRYCIDSFHQWHIFQRVSHFVGFANGRFDKDVCTRSQVISPSTVNQARNPILTQSEVSKTEAISYLTHNY